MKTLTRMFTAIAAAGAVLVALLLFAGSANAASGNPQSPTPTGGSGVLSVSTTTPTEGGSITVSGQGCNPGATVTATLDTGDQIGSATAGSNGSFSITGQLPSGVTGEHTITVQGAGCSGVLAINIQAASSGSGNLAGTGVAVVGIGALGVVLLVGGGLMLLAGRRRAGHHA